jgi:hypothetical protein
MKVNQLSGVDKRKRSRFSFFPQPPESLFNARYAVAVAEVCLPEQAKKQKRQFSFLNESGPLKLENLGLLG